LVSSASMRGTQHGNWIRYPSAESRNKLLANAMSNNWQSASIYSCTVDRARVWGKLAKNWARMRAVQSYTNTSLHPWWFKIYLKAGNVVYVLMRVQYMDAVIWTNNIRRQYETDIENISSSSYNRYRCEDCIIFRCPRVAWPFQTPDLLSSSETLQNPGIKSWKSPFREAGLDVRNPLLVVYLFPKKLKNWDSTILFKMWQY
jgi:hypothetical protein